MRSFIYRLTAGASLLLLCGFASCASFGAPAASRPTVFRDEAVNVVVLPYSAVSGSSAAFYGFTDTAEQLSYLVQLQTLAAVLKYRNVATVRLVSQSWDAIDVADQLVGKTGGASRQLRPGRGLVLIWGKIAESHDQVLVRSFVRFLRRDRSEDLRLNVGAVTFRARLPFTSLSFEGRPIRREDLQAIKEEFEQSAVVRQKPSEDSPGEPLPLDPHSKFFYRVIDTQKGWMKIEGVGGPSGWVHLSATEGQMHLEKLMPELSFVEGVAGYLGLRVGDEEGGLPARASTTRWAKNAIDRFDELTGTEGSPAEKAAAAALRGAVALVTAHTPAALRAAEGSFDQAASLAPDNVDARNLSLVSHIYCAYREAESGLRVREVADDLLQIAGLEPTNPLALENLRSFYKLLKASGPPAGEDKTFHLGAEEIKRRSTVLAAVR
jgi:hypothetical protein